MDVNNKIRVGIVDDHQLVIDGIRLILKDEPDMRLVMQANSGKETLDKLKQNKPDVLLTDIEMPGMSGVELTRRIRRQMPEVKILALTIQDDGVLVNKMVEAGASGYILKSCSADELLEAVVEVNKGNNYLSQKVQKIILSGVFNREAPVSQIQKGAITLTPRESEILDLIAQEYSNEAIAKKLFISERTVETHRKNLFTKTKTKSVVGLIKFAIKHELLQEV
ncbi:MAG: response regulator transcription factor [Bacteroidales bacterium]|nr:response regulator transcription factor [Bacteroidales bacterium]